MTSPRIPEALLKKCEEPILAQTLTFGELAKYSMSLKTALKKCNNDKNAIRKMEEERRQ